MLKNYFKGLIPSVHDLRRSRMLSRFGDALFAGALWRVSRRPLRRAFLIGLFAAFLPIPFQMFLVAFICLRVQANLPMALALVWVSNPLTTAPIFYVEYQIGVWLLDVEMLDFAHLGMSNPFPTLLWSLMTGSLSLMTGSLVLAAALGTSGYLVADFFWGLSIQQKWNARRRKKLQTSS